MKISSRRIRKRKLKEGDLVFLAPLKIKKVFTRWNLFKRQEIYTRKLIQRSHSKLTSSKILEKYWISGGRVK